MKGGFAAGGVWGAGCPHGLAEVVVKGRVLEEMGVEAGGGGDQGAGAGGGADGVEATGVGVPSGGEG